MATVNVQSPQGDLARTVDLPDAVFDVQVNVPLIHQVVVAQLAAARQGTHDTKTRGEVRGGGRKPYKQKGTGRARQGSTRAPQFAGGGVVHGPTPRNYEQRTPKKMKAAALRGALSDRARGGRLHVVSALVEGDAPSTKLAAVALAKIVSSRHVLVVAQREDVVTWKSLRNVETVHVIAPDQLNTYDVLVSDDVVFTEGALAAFLNKPGTPEGKALGEAVETLAAESAPKGGRRTAAPAKKVAAEPTPERAAEPATDAGTTKPAGEDVSDADAVAEVAEQTSPDLKVDPAAQAPADDIVAESIADEDADQGGEA
jgi:large subunit ribosomal protein L4